jgi:hypothetical protein
LPRQISIPKPDFNLLRTLRTQHRPAQLARMRTLVPEVSLFTYAVQLDIETSGFEIIVSQNRATSCLYKKGGSYKAIEHALVHLRQRLTLTLKVSIARFDDISGHRVRGYDDLLWRHTNV